MNSLETAKAGDKVVVYEGRWHSSARYGIITRATKTMLFVGPNKYRRDGYEVGNRYGRTHIALATPEECKNADATIRETNLRRRINIAREKLSGLRVYEDNIVAVEEFLKALAK